MKNHVCDICGQECMTNYVWLVTIHDGLKWPYTLIPGSYFCFSSKDEAIRYLKCLDFPIMETSIEDRYYDEHENIYCIHRLQVVDKLKER